VSEFRQHIVDYLITHGPVEDTSGRATSALKEAVYYKHGDAAFSQLLSSMEKDGELGREVRGKRTYRIFTTSSSAAVMAPASAVTEVSGDIDYDELAAALLVKTVRALTTSQEPADSGAWARRRIEQLEGRIDKLQRELARAKAEANANADQRDELRGQLEAASHNLGLLTERAQAPKQGRAAERLDGDERALLYELRGSRRRSGSAG